MSTAQGFPKCRVFGAANSRIPITCCYAASGLIVMMCCATMLPPTGFLIRNIDGLKRSRNLTPVLERKRKKKQLIPADDQKMGIYYIFYFLTPKYCRPRLRISHTQKRILWDRPPPPTRTANGIVRIPGAYLERCVRVKSNMTGKYLPANYHTISILNREQSNHGFAWLIIYFFYIVDRIFVRSIFYDNPVHP